jgi:glycyl-tRNA synthetase
MADCKKCKKRFKVEDLKDKKKCGECGGELTEARPFNLMFETYHGPVKETAAIVYLRPETAQGIFVNFLNVLDVSRKKLPFGVAQIGKAFRNEITPGNFTFRTREFEQMEIEYFVRPQEADKYYEDWVEERFNWYMDLGIKKDNLRKREHKKDELAHYAKACSDIEYNFPFGWSELEGIANRTDFDLKQHSEFSGKELKYFDDQSKEKYFPYIIEPSGGVDRATLAFLVDSYNEEEVKGETRVFLKLHKDLAPTKVAVFPLLKNRPQLVEVAKKISSGLKKKFICVYDDTAAIGKLYRRQDEVGTLFCVTVDVQSLEDKKVTVRDRDTMQQERISVDKLQEYLQEKLKNN